MGVRIKGKENNNTEQSEEDDGGDWMARGAHQSDQA